MKYAFLTMLIVVLTGCASTEKFVLSENVEETSLVTLNVYRTDVAFHSLNPEKPFIHLNDKLIAKLGTGQSKTIKFPSGKHRLSVRQSILFMPGGESNFFEYEFMPSEEYYLRHNYGFSGATFIGGTIAITGTIDFHLTTKENYLGRK